MSKKRYRARFKYYLLMHFKKIGILRTHSSIHQEQRLTEAFLLDKRDVRIIMPNDKTIVDCLILPDTGGLNCVGPFFPHFDVPPVFPGQDQWMEFFRINFLNYWINKKVPIVGIGTSGLMLYHHVLGGKLDCMDGEVEPFRDPNVAFFYHNNGDNWTFKGDNILGIYRELEPDDLVILIGKAFPKPEKADDGGLHSVTVPTIPPIVPLQMKNSKEK